MSAEKIILLADMESFYASVETVLNPSLKGKPVVVCGDPERRHGIVLAASKEAKKYGIKTGMLAGECRRVCPGTVFVPPNMKRYLEYSVEITGIMSRFTDLVHVYSVDEQFLDMSGCRKLFGTPEEMASEIIETVMAETGIRCRIGIGENALQSKMACDRFAKKNSDGIFRLAHQTYSTHVWPLPIRDLFGVGSRMERNLRQIGVRKIGHLAALPKEKLRQRWGINGELLWLNAHGIDHSIIESGREEPQKGVGHAMTMPRDYRDLKEIGTVLLELTEETCRRVRALGKLASVAQLYCQGADFAFPTGFSKQKKLFDPTANTMDVYPVLHRLFLDNWDRRAIRRLGIGLTGFSDSLHYQPMLFEDKEKKRKLAAAMDTVRERYGTTSLFRLASLTSGGQLFERAEKIGGH